MKYGNVNLKIKFDSLLFVIAKAQEIRHYPGTDNSDSVNKGRMPTRITCQIIVENKSDLIVVQQILHSSEEKELYFEDIFYKKVVAGQQGKPKPITADKKVWSIDAEFVALDPIPYDVETGEVKY